MNKITKEISIMDSTKPVKLIDSGASIGMMLFDLTNAIGIENTLVLRPILI
jgi:hypothetical protein